MTVLEIVWLLLFVVSGGLLFNERYRKNWIAVGLAAAIAITATYYLTEQVVRDVLRREYARDTVKPLDSTTGTQSATDPRSIDLAYWQSISSSGDVALYEQYLQKFPNGEFAGLARSRIKSLRAAAADQPRQQPSPRPVSSQPPPFHPIEPAPEDAAPQPASSPASGKKCVQFNGQLICE